MGGWKQFLPGISGPGIHGTGIHGPEGTHCRQTENTALRRVLWKQGYSQDPTLSAETCPGSL